MLPVDDFNGVSSSDQVLINLAVDIGIDPSNAADVLGAVKTDPGGERGECTLLIGGSPAPLAPADDELARIVKLLAAELPAAQAAGRRAGFR